MADGGKAPADNPARWWRKGMKLVLWPFIFPPILFLLILLSLFLGRVFGIARF
jgi:hypothetical protein